MSQPDNRFEQGRTLLLDGRYKEAGDIFAQLSKEMPKFKKAWESLAFTYVQLNDYDRAIACYEEILIRYPKDHAFWNQKAVLEEQTGQYDKAMASVEKALKFDPGNAEYLYSKGFILYRQKQLNDAIMYFDRALETDPFLFAAADLKCVCLMSLGIYDELAASCILFIDRFESFVVDGSEEDREGTLFGKGGDVELRKEDMRRLYSYQSFAFMKMGAFEKSEEVLEKELLISPDDAGVYYYLGLMQNATGKLQKAVVSFERVIELDPNFMSARIQLGFVLSKINTHDSLEQALLVFDKIVAIEPENLSVRYEVGKIHLRLNEPEKALAAFNYVSQMDPAFIPVYEEIGKLKLASAGQNPAMLDEAVAVLSKAQNIDPFHYEITNMLGIVYAKKGDNTQAIQNFDRAIHADPFNPKAYFNKALILVKEKRYEEAVQFFAESLRYDALNPDVLDNYATTLFKLERYSDALTVFKKLKTVEPNYENVDENIQIVEDKLKN
ncbi:Lipopolysaccharide assembly protein B [Methanosarcinaceae archaeon Ag5]|uniref:Lipopolysaccharide assembly protein B n=1 Tax=Methanolapillus africanus TaxID=3028297 RepID=A0AAE4MJZ5_9EURY|nr:Lipopolysaccharide assembly protein B [Methanosarcinaceae archaeon Ag5]